MNYIVKSLRVSLIDAIVVSIFVLLMKMLFYPLEINFAIALPFFLLFFISSLTVAKLSKKEPVSIFLYPFLRREDSALLKISLVLSLIGCIALFYSIVELFPNRDLLILILIGFPIMGVSLIFTTRPETSIKGGIIILIIGVIGVLAFIGFGGGFTLFFGPGPDIPLARFSLECLWLLSSIMTIVGGSLGIKEGEKYYANEILKIKGEIEIHSNAPFIIPIISFVFAIVFSSYALYALFGIDDVISAGAFAMSILLPLVTISVIFNIISMFIIGRETNPKKKLIEIILIIITWCLIISPVVIVLFAHFFHLLD